MTVHKKHNSYLLVNGLLAGIIVLIFLYSALFSAGGWQHPIPSQYTQEVASTGLSRAFSALMRGNLQAAQAYNSFAVRLFLFFLAQLLLRLLVHLALFKNRFPQNKVLFIDILLSLLLFLPTFGVFIVMQLRLAL